MHIQQNSNTSSAISSDEYFHELSDMSNPDVQEIEHDLVSLSFQSDLMGVSNGNACMSQMAGVLTSSKQSRLESVANSISRKYLRMLPGRAVTHDEKTTDFEKRLQKYKNQIQAITGECIYPDGAPLIQCVHGEAQESKAAKVELTHQRAPANVKAPGVVVRNSQAQVAYYFKRDEDPSSPAVITLPSGGNATACIAVEVQSMGDVIGIELGRRVNAKRIFLTPQGAKDLAQKLELQIQWAKNQKPQPRVLDAQGGAAIRLPKGGVCAINQLQDVKLQGDVVCVTMERKFNGKSFLLETRDARKFFEKIHAEVDCI